MRRGGPVPPTTFITVYYVCYCMKAIVLAGGHATRLWPITRNRAKPLLPLDGRPIIDYIVADLEDNDDVEEILISTNRKYAPDFEEYIEEHGHTKSRVVVEDQRSEEDKPGTIGAILKILDEEGPDDYLIVGGDNYYSFRASAFLDAVDGRPMVACYDIGDPEDASAFGVVATDGDGRITDFVEKPDEPPSSLVSMACYYFPEDRIGLFQQYEQHFAATDVPREQYLDEPGRLIEWAHQQTPMDAFTFTGSWFDVGTRQGYLAAERSLTDGDNVIDGDVADTELGDNVVVMEGAEVRDCRLDDCIVFPGSRLDGVTLSGSIVDRHARLEDVAFTDSLVGEHSQLHR